MVALEKDSGRNRFRSVRCSARLDNQHVYLPARAKQALEAQAGAKLSIIPFE